MKEYKPGITVITPTANRPEALDRCWKYVVRQTLKPDQWIVSDASSEYNSTWHTIYEPCKELYNIKLNYLTRPFSSSKAKSFTGNVLNLIAHVEYEHIIVMEDDDYYAPTYIEELMKQWSYYPSASIIGWGNTLYYNIHHRKYRIQGNEDRASFCETAFKSNLIVKLKKACEVKRDSAFVDRRLWHFAYENASNHHPRILTRSEPFSRLSAGIKGMPGLAGIGIGHRPGSGYHVDTVNWKMLKKFIGEEDAQYYINLHKEGKTVG